MQTSEEYAKLATGMLASVIWPDPNHEGHTITHHPNSAQLAAAQVYATLAQAAATAEWIDYSKKLSAVLTGEKV